MKQLVRLNKRPLCGGRKFTYVLRYVENGKRRWKTLGHANRRKAEKQRSKKEKELRMGYIEPESMSLKYFMKDSLYRTGDQIRPGTQHETKSAMNDFIETIGNIDFQYVTLAHGELYRQACLDRGNRPATVSKKLRHIKRLFQLAVYRKQLDENPLQYIEMPKVYKKKFNVYTDAQCARIFKVAQECVQESDIQRMIRWDILILVALSTAMRRGELLNCIWSDIDFEAQTIEISPKEDTEKTWKWCVKDNECRTLPLTEEIVQLLADHQSQQPEEHPYVFVPPARYDYIQNELRAKGKWKSTDSRLNVLNCFWLQFDRIRKRASIKKGSFHDIRRTAISMWFANGLSEYDVMKLAGHSSFSTTHEFYLAVTDDLVDRARVATALGLSQKMVQIGADGLFDEKQENVNSCNCLSEKRL